MFKDWVYFFSVYLRWQIHQSMVVLLLANDGMKWNKRGEEQKKKMVGISRPTSVSMHLILYIEKPLVDIFCACMNIIVMAD